MAAAFVPLTLPAPLPNSASAGVASRAGADTNGGVPLFQPLDAARPTLTPVPKAAPAGGSNHCAAAAPQVTVERQDGQITKIRVQCVCGEVTELDCLY